MAKSKPEAPAPDLGRKSTFPPGHFSVWLVLPKEQRAALRSAAAALDLPMSHFARRAVEDAIRRVQGGERPFPDAGEKNS